MTARLVALLFFALLGYGVWSLARTEASPESTTEGAEPAQTAEDPAAVAPMSATVPVAGEEKTEPVKHMFKLPDGTYTRVLNGAYGAPAMLWPKDRPYSPIIGTEVDTHGQEWYVHADGSKSTTTMGWRKDLGRLDAMTQVANPTTPATREPAR